MSLSEGAGLVADTWELKDSVIMALASLKRRGWSCCIFQEVTVAVMPILQISSEEIPMQQRTNVALQAWRLCLIDLTQFRLRIGIYPLQLTSLP